jgi:adenylate cyclase
MQGHEVLPRAPLRLNRSILRLASALVLLAFVVTHLAAHSALVVSQAVADPLLVWLMRPWRSLPGTVLLATAFLAHYGNALWSIYVRRTLQLKRWEWAQLGLGLCIPPLLALHVASTKLAEASMGIDLNYTWVLVEQWVLAPHQAAIQVAMLSTLWLHACIGLNFWLRTKRWFAQWRPYLGAVALAFPLVALAGYISAGSQIVREAEKDPKVVGNALADVNATDATLPSISRMAFWLITAHLGLVGLAFAGRSVRRRLLERRMPPQLSHPCGRVFPVLAGATVLETLRDHGIPHASVCGGRARCTTCRIHVGRGGESLPPPGPLEAKALARIGAPPGMRLACQVRPSADLAVTPLLAADATPAEGFTPGGLEGSERQVTVMFVDLRGSTTLGEAKLPYDVLFILNRLFSELNQAIAATNGHYSQFTGDGLMALYGLDSPDPASGPADALRGARDMLMRVERLNRELKAELPHPLVIGIGIHHSEAIVGMMGPPRSMIITAIGDTVNTTARLESLTKEYQATVIISKRAAEIAGLNLPIETLHEAPVKGRVESVQFHALKTIPELPR